MLRYALRSLRANATRLVATALAVVIGITFLASGLILTDALRAGLTGDVERRYAEVDLAVVASSGAPGLGPLQTVPEATIDQVLDTAGVAAAAGQLQADVRVLRADGVAASLRSQGRPWIDDDLLNPLELTEGRAPADGDEIALDARLADEAGTGVGQVVELETPAGSVEATVVGISRFGDRDAVDDGGTVSFPADRATEVLNAGTPGFNDVIVRTDGDPAEVAGALRAVLPGSLEVLDRPAYLDAATADAAAFIDFLRPVLQGFAYLAMFVSAFVIFNTFSVVVTQRFRELALIRAIGGTPAQLRRSLVLEGLGIGVVASAIGVLVGLVLTVGIQWVLARLELGLPQGGVALTVGTVVLCLTVGTVVTVLSVLVPAFRAGRTRPVEAMRTSAVDSSGTSVVRAVIGGSFLAIAAAAITLNAILDPQWYFVATATLSLFLGVFVGGPLLARLFARLVQPVLGRTGLTGRLATDNTVRNPRRTATTANALVIGLFLVTLVTVSGEAMKTAVVDELNELSESDFIIGAERSLDPSVVDEVDATDGVTDTAPVRFGLTSFDGGGPALITTADLDELTTAAGMRPIAGDPESVTSGDGLAVPDLSEFGGSASGQPVLRLGDRITLASTDGEAVTLEVTVLLDGGVNSLLLDYVVGAETFERLAGDQPVSLMFVRVEPGEADEVGRRLDAALSDYTGVEVQPGNFFGQIIAGVFDFLIGAVNALLGMSVVVALVGIVNTMTLSIFERRRELGMVRALGMTRQQVGRMIRAEAVLIGLLGTLVGMGSGILVSWVVVSSLADGMIGLSFNWARVGLIFLVGIGVGVLASLLPARRATRLDPLEAMRD